MDVTKDVREVTRSDAQYDGEFEAREAGKVSSELLIAAAEYEFEQVKKAFADNKLETEPDPPVQPRKSTLAAFAARRRKFQNGEASAGVQSLD
jgi:hypothetical protein